MSHFNQLSPDPDVSPPSGLRQGSPSPTDPSFRLTLPQKSLPPRNPPQTQSAPTKEQIGCTKVGVLLVLLSLFVLGLLSMFLLFPNNAVIIAIVSILLTFIIAFITYKVFEKTWEDFIEWLTRFRLGSHHFARWTVTAIGTNKRLSASLFLNIVLLALIVSLLWRFLPPQQPPSQPCNPLQALCPDGLGITKIEADNNLVRVGIMDENIYEHSDVGFNPFDKDGMERQFEGLIFAENHKILTDHASYITLVVATSLSQTIADKTLSVSEGLEDLQGAYLAQHDFNKKHSFRLRLLVANIGTKDDPIINQTVPPLAKQLMNLRTHDPTFKGIAGFPFSRSAVLALNSLSGIPIVSSSASSTQLTNRPFFHRVVPNNDQQSQDILTILNTVITPQQKVAIFEDPKDPYSHSLASSVFGHPGTNAFIESFTEGQASTIESALIDMQRRPSPAPTAIIFTAYADDLDTLKRLMVQRGITLPLIGGEAFYELGGYQNGDYANLHFTAYASPDAIYYSSDVTIASHNFLDEYIQAFDPACTHPGVYGFTRPGPHALQTYDAVNALLHSISSPTDTLTQIDNTLKTVTFAGVSGQITLNGSDPIRKPVLQMYVNNEHHTMLVANSGPSPSFTMPSANACSTQVTSNGS